VMSDIADGERFEMAKQRIAALEAEVVRLTDERDGWRDQNGALHQTVEGLHSELANLRAFWSEFVASCQPGYMGGLIFNDREVAEPEPLSISSLAEKYGIGYVDEEGILHNALEATDNAT
jgi:hypothetical protein